MFCRSKLIPLNKATNYHQLEFADIFRDGGSFEARFRSSDGQRIVVYLEAHPDSPKRHRMRHVRLFVYKGEEMPIDAEPVGKNSAEEAELLAGLDTFLTAPQFANAKEDTASLERLREMRRYIPAREGT